MKSIKLYRFLKCIIGSPWNEFGRGDFGQSMRQNQCALVAQEKRERDT